MSILTFPGGHSRTLGAPAPAFPADLLNDDAWRLRRVERLLCVLHDRVRCEHCVNELIWDLLQTLPQYEDGLTALERLARRVSGETRQ